MGRVRQIGGDKTNVHRLGLLGGTFDPPHVGHLWLAETARGQLKLDKVLFLPVGDPPHKQDKKVTAVTNRIHMLKLALAHDPHFELDTTDVTRPLPHTTISLLPIIQAAYPQAHLWLIIGQDSLRDFPTWINPQEIIRQCRLGVLSREQAAHDWEVLETAVPGLQAATDYLQGPTLAISSTEIRRWAKLGHSLRFLLADEVKSYITQNQLYA